MDDRAPMRGADRTRHDRPPSTIALKFGYEEAGKSVADFTASIVVIVLPHNARQRERRATRGEHEDRRRQEKCLFDAADQSVVSAGAVPFLQPRIFCHHLSDRSGSARGGGAGAARGHGFRRQIRIHPDARLDRLRRLHRNRAGDPGPPQWRGWRLYPRDVSGRRRADRRRPRVMGISQEAGDAQDRGRKRRAGGNAALRLGALRLGARWATSTVRSTTTRC